MKSDNYARLSTRSGLTLVEVVTSIALLSALMITMLSIHGRHVRQIRLAYQKHRAIEQLDSLVATWMKSEDTLPANTMGRFGDTDDLYWVSTLRPATISNARWQAGILRVEVFNQSEVKPLVALEVLYDPGREVTSR